MTISSLATITSNYGHLNGIDAMNYGGYGGYGFGGYGFGGVWGTANTEQAKERVANNYDIYATQQGYRSKQGVETVNYNQQCMLLAEDLKKGETDQVSERFEDMVNAMKNSPQYANYSESEICSLIRNQYTTATGSDLVVDINKNASGAFIQGVKRSIPIFGLGANKNSKADLVAQVTCNNKSRNEKTAKTMGYVTGGATGAAAMVGTAWFLTKKTGAGKSIAEKGVKAISQFAKKGNGKGKIALITVGVAAATAFIASLFGNGSNKKTNE